MNSIFLASNVWFNVDWIFKEFFEKSLKLGTLEKYWRWCGLGPSLEQVVRCKWKTNVLTLPVKETTIKKIFKLYFITFFLSHAHGGENNGSNHPFKFFLLSFKK